MVMDKLYDLERIARERGAFTEKIHVNDPDGIQRIKMRYAVWAIAYYIGSNRTTVKWEKAFEKANSEKLLAYVIRSEDESDEAYYRRTTEYLQRYCGLDLCGEHDV